MLPAILVVRFLPWLLFLCRCNGAPPTLKQWKGYSKEEDDLIIRLLLDDHHPIIPIHSTNELWVPIAEKYNSDENIGDKRQPGALKKHFTRMLESPNKVPEHLLARIPPSFLRNKQPDEHEDPNIEEGQARNAPNPNSKAGIRKHVQDEFLIDQVLNYNLPTSLCNKKMWSTIATRYNQKNDEDRALFPHKRSPRTLERRFTRILKIDLQGDPRQETLMKKLGLTCTEQKKDKIPFNEAQTALIIEELLQTRHTNPYNDKLWQEIKEKYDVKREADPEGFPERTRGSLRARFGFHIREEEGLVPPQLMDKFPKAFAKLRAKMEDAGPSQYQDQQDDLQDIGEEDNDEDEYFEDEFNEDECHENDFYEEQLPQEGQQIHHEGQQVPYGYPPIPYGYPQLPDGYSQLPSGYPQLPSGYPQLPSVHPQLPSGYPQLHSGYPQLHSGYPQLPYEYQPLTHEGQQRLHGDQQFPHQGQQFPHEDQPCEDQLPDDPDTDLRLSQPDDLTLRLSQPGQ